MHKYHITISKTAQKQLDKLTTDVANRLIKVIFDLANNPRPVGFIKLKDRSGYRIRQGNYRIIYDIIDSNLIIDIIAVGHRKDIYK
ncbi:MAG: type II toxin-antitoxin system RelE/ParE family toxin [Daejeonella sp.]